MEFRGHLEFECPWTSQAHMGGLGCTLTPEAQDL